MGKFITVLALLFFAASGVITFMALQLPSRESLYQEAGNHRASEPAAAREDVAPSAADRGVPEKEASVEELQARIASLEESLARKEAEEAPDYTAGSREPEMTERALAVLGAGAFQSGQVVVEKDMVETVKGLVPEIAASPGYRVLIEGHTDNIPIRASSEEPFRDNIELSFLRAKAVADILAENGVSSDRISVIGHGDSRPIASNKTPEGRVKNRRVEIKLIPQSRGGQ